MKNRILCRLWPLSRLVSGLVLALGASALAGCSSDEAPIEAMVNPLGAGAPPVVPASAGGGEAEEPGATETNFLTPPPCSEDADCAGDSCGSRKVSDAGAGDAGATDAGAGDASSGLDADADAGTGGIGGANDAVPAPKRCKSPSSP